MAKENDHPSGVKSTNIPPRKKQRQMREASALRENLKRRKQQLQARKDATKDTDKTD